MIKSQPFYYSHFHSGGNQIQYTAVGGVDQGVYRNENLLQTQNATSQTILAMPGATV